MEVELAGRTARVLSYVDPVRESSGKVEANLYHETENPKGIVDLCMSQNTLISDVLLEKLNQPDVTRWEEGMLVYTERNGARRLRVALADFLTSQTGAPKPLNPDKFCIMNGVTGIMNLLCFVLFNDGDTLLCPAPLYYSIPRDIMDVAGVKIYPIKLSSKPGPNGEKPFELTAEHLKAALEKATQEGHEVKGVFLVNPNNPIGCVYTRDAVLTYLDFCKQHKLHVLMDEIYQFSNHDESVPNSSVLGIPLDDMPDPMRTHVLYGFSKDFGIPGSPLGALYTWNPDVLKVCVRLNDFQQAASSIQIPAARLLEDKDWLHGTFFPTNLFRLRAALLVAMETLDEIGASYSKPSAGLFIWADLSKFLAANTPEEEAKLTDHLLKCGVGLSPSAGYCGGEFGWYRIMFAVPPHQLREGLKRLKEACLSFSAKT
ncbi:1-aminocyclopropane-1-carboxylate synthase-like protein 1 [Diadema antillarum]|uniref:1-aminocyclopropane-1-carboxylate synthase-like protein 1 n=1 Tax=Diadema antillarum TaxID=105358 RepID=UPI003A8A7868